MFCVTKAQKFINWKKVAKDRGKKVALGKELLIIIRRNILKKLLNKRGTLTQDEMRIPTVHFVSLNS